MAGCQALPTQKGGPQGQVLTKAAIGPSETHITRLGNSQACLNQLRDSGEPGRLEESSREGVYGGPEGTKHSGSQSWSISCECGSVDVEQGQTEKQASKTEAGRGRTIWLEAWEVGQSTLLSASFSGSVVSDSATLWTAARQPSLSFTISWSWLRLMCIESVMTSNHLFLCHPLLFLPLIFPSRVFSHQSALHIRWPKYWSFSIGPSVNIQD